MDPSNTLCKHLVLQRWDGSRGRGIKASEAHRCSTGDAWPRSRGASCCSRWLPIYWFRTAAPCVWLWMQKRWSNWEISKAASSAVQIDKNYLILGSWSRHPLVILSIKCMKLLIINNELFARVKMNRENKKKHGTFAMHKCWLSQDISSEILFAFIKKYIHKPIFLVFELQVRLDRSESVIKQIYAQKSCLIQEVTFL